MSQCECCDNALQHAMRYLLAYDAHAPVDMKMPRPVILSELAEALDEYQECQAERFTATIATDGEEAA